MLCATTANDGHFGPLLPFARALAGAGHEVRVAAPVSYAGAVAGAGFAHEPFADAPPELIGPVMARLPTLAFDEADEVVIREVFGRIDAQAALPSLMATVDRWRPDLVMRESAELASLAAAERAGVPHVHVCIGMHEVVPRFAEAIADPLDELGRMAGLIDGRLPAALASETILSLVPEVLDRASGQELAGGDGFLRFNEPLLSVSSYRLPEWGDPEAPLVYVTFGSVTGSLPPFAGVFREALDALADIEVRVLLTVGRRIDPAALGLLPSNARAEQWCPQDAVLEHAAAMLGHGGFGTTMGALTAGVPQMVVPLFTFDQVVNGQHVAAVGAGLTVEKGPASVGPAAAQVLRLLEDPTFAVAARRIATALRNLPPPTEAIPFLTGLAR
ncbi:MULTISPECIES: glycosyltransferase [Nocardioides]|uniref:glycosyltransferase n=1 Tax=Nocardioides TaxID=1839 RepID=UPI002E13DD6A